MYLICYYDQVFSRRSSLKGFISFCLLLTVQYENQKPSTGVYIPFQENLIFSGMKCCWSEISEYVKVRLYDSQNNKVLKCFLSSLLGLLPLLNNHQQNMLHIHSYRGMISLPCLLMVMAYFLSTLSQINVNLALANLVSRRVLRGPTLFN